MNAQTRATTDLMVLMMATLSGIAIVILGVMIGGHGWSVFRLSATAIVLTPAGALTWCYRDQRIMPAIARWLLAAFLVIDVVIAIGAYRQFGQTADTIDSINPAAALIWATLWSFWQLMTLLAAWKRG